MMVDFNFQDSKSFQLRLLESMYRIRVFEERTKSLFRQNKIYGALHLYIGQEAVAAGVGATLNKDDYILSTHRGHGHCIAKGAEFKYMLAELMGKVTGYSGGHGGSMHIFCEELGLLGGNGIVGGGIPISVGVGHSIKHRKSGQVVICFFGDGAVNNGAFHESLNMAALWSLPVVYICENNVYAATTRTEDVTLVQHIAHRAAGYGIPGDIVDGNDVEDVFESAKKAVDRARAGEGPSLIECKTYRIENHCMVLHQAKPVEELNAWKEKDPLECYECKLIEQEIVTEQQIVEMKKRNDQLLDKAERFALDSPFPEPEKVFSTFMV